MQFSQVYNSSVVSVCGACLPLSAQQSLLCSQAACVRWHQPSNMQSFVAAEPDELGWPHSSQGAACLFPSSPAPARSLLSLTASVRRDGLDKRDQRWKRLQANSFVALSLVCCKSVIFALLVPGCSLLNVHRLFNNLLQQWWLAITSWCSLLCWIWLYWKIGC